MTEMALPFTSPYPVMEAQTRPKLPEGAEWQYEPKWDGFRCLAFRDGESVELQSKAGRSLTRYFPDVVENLRALRVPRCVLDGELIISVDGEISFDDLLLRIHPAASRVKMLARTRPANLIVFDLLVDETGADMTNQSLERRRAKLNRFAQRYFGDSSRIELSPASRRIRDAEEWFRATAGGLDGVVAKRVDLPYRGGERTAVVKVKNIRSADCVVGGFRFGQNRAEIGSLLLGLYDYAGLLHHVGFTSSLTAAQRKLFKTKVEELLRHDSKDRGFSGRAPGGPSRWSHGRETEWEPLPPELVVEITYDHFSGQRFRHGTRFLRWRPDKSPGQCTMDQVEHPGRSPLRLLKAG